MPTPQRHSAVSAGSQTALEVGPRPCEHAGAPIPPPARRTAPPAPAQNAIFPIVAQGKAYSAHPSAAVRAVRAVRPSSKIRPRPCAHADTPTPPLPRPTAPPARAQGGNFRCAFYSISSVPHMRATPPKPLLAGPSAELRRVRGVGPGLHDSICPCACAGIFTPSANPPTGALAR